jgi:hypothetical protein
MLRKLNHPKCLFRSTAEYGGVWGTLRVWSCLLSGNPNAKLVCGMWTHPLRPSDHHAHVVLGSDESAHWNLPMWLVGYCRFIKDGIGSVNTAGVRSPTEAEDSSSSLCVQTGSGAYLASYTMGTGGSFPGGKARPGHDAYHSSFCSAEVKKE